MVSKKMCEISRIIIAYVLLVAILWGQFPGVCVKAATPKLSESKISLCMDSSHTMYVDSDTSVKEWTSSDESIVKISKSSNTKKVTVKSVGEGNATVIGVCEDGSSVECEVTVFLPDFYVSTEEVSLGLSDKTKEKLYFYYDYKNGK